MTDDDERQVLGLIKKLHLAVWPLVAIGLFGLWATVTTDMTALPRTCGLIGSLLCFYLAWVLHNGATKIVPMLAEAIADRDARKSEWKSKLAQPEDENLNKGDEKCTSV